MNTLIIIYMLCGKPDLVFVKEQEDVYVITQQDLDQMNRSWLSALIKDGADVYITEEQRGLCT